MTRLLLDRPLDRRRLLDISWKASAGAIALSLLPGDDLFAAPALGANPFTLGVASGDPTPDGIVLWTRLAPDPLVGGGMPARAVGVHWRVASDEGMQTIVAQGQATAIPELAHSVHVEVSGLRPRRYYWYQFSYGQEEESPIGRFRTAPAATESASELRFAVVTCQRWDQGHYTVLRDVAAQKLDAVFHLGDYLYEYSPLQNVRGMVLDPARFTGQTVTLERYRDQYALYKMDADLQAAHHAHPFVVIWDDHEVQNDYSGRHPENNQVPPREFVVRRAAAYQAFYEHMPIRATLRTDKNNHMRIYRSLSYGRSANFIMLDDRQYRSDNPCGDGESARCEGAFDPKVTMLGEGQEAWLARTLKKSDAEWTFIVQQLLVAQLDHNRSPTVDRFWNDAWDGYPGARDRLLDTIVSRKVRNPVILTGDWHSTFVNDIKRDFAKPYSKLVATEFVTPAISSGGDGTPYGPYYAPMIPYNQHIRYYDGDRRGYFLMKLQQSRLDAELRMVTNVGTPDGTPYKAGRFVVENGRPGAYVERV
jgi:alkaline phosphatase D